MQQLALFANDAPRTLVDDASGRIIYTPGVVDEVRARAWFEDLRTAIEWHSERRPMYDRIVDVPRLTAGFRPGDALPAALREAKDVVQAALGERFNAVGLNFYRDGRDSVAMHNDHLDEIEPRSPVALLSLGSPRVMRIASKKRPRRVFTIALEPGSLFVMAGAAQEHWEHGIPKTSDAVGPRISVAFRRRLLS